MKIRPAFADDAAVIARLATELGYPTSSADMADRLDTLLRNDACFIAVAEVSGEVVAWVAAERRLLLESGERAELVGLVVSERSRRAGIGAKLVQAAEHWAQQQGMRSINVRSNVARIEAHPFYERLGYTRTKTQHAYTKQLSAAK